MASKAVASLWPQERSHITTISAWRRRKIQLATLKDDRRFEKALSLHSAILSVSDREDGSGEECDSTNRSEHVYEERTALVGPIPAEVSGGVCLGDRGCSYPSLSSSNCGVVRVRSGFAKHFLGSQLFMPAPFCEASSDEEAEGICPARWLRWKNKGRNSWPWPGAMG